LRPGLPEVVDISDLEVNRLRLLSDRLIDVRPLGGVRLSKNCHLNPQGEHLFESNGFTAPYGRKIRIYSILTVSQ
jgi:hypothetical protein